MSDQPASEPNAVTEWFGPKFSELHPQLQALHRSGGKLRGQVQITARGWLGRRLGKMLNVPVDYPSRRMEVEIRHTGGALWWLRRFDNGEMSLSIFRPHGAWPTGHWTEQRGATLLRMTVDVIDGGWHWRPLGVRVHGIPLPLWLFPSSRAGKRIEQGRYVFEVAFALPLVGTVLSYAGTLDLAAGG